MELRARRLQRSVPQDPVQARAVRSTAPRATERERVAQCGELCHVQCPTQRPARTGGGTIRCAGRGNGSARALTAEGPAESPDCCEQWDRSDRSGVTMRDAGKTCKTGKAGETGVLASGQSQGWLSQVAKLRTGKASREWC